MASSSNCVSGAVSSTSTELMFVNADVPESGTLLAGIAPHVEVISLPPNCDGLSYISDTLTGRNGIKALHILGHGASNHIEFGSTVLSLQNVDTAAEDLSSWRPALGFDAEILLYGCQVAQSSDGVALIERLANMTGAKVAASSNATGAESLGGDWQLEASTAPIKTALPFSTEAVSGWQHTLNHFRYGTMSWETVPGEPNTVIIKGQVDWTNSHGHIPASTPIGGIVPNKLTLDFGDGTTQSVAVRVISRDPVTNDVLTEFVSDINNDGAIGAGEVGIKHTFPSSGTYNVLWGSGARESAINQDSSNWQQITRIDLAQAGNNSPVIATPSVVQVVDNTVFTYQLAASDPDGNPLRFRYGTQDEFYANGVLTEATRPTGLQLSPTGQITWDVRDSVLSTNTGDRWQVTIMAEEVDANGNVRSTVPVDFVLQLVAAGSQPPVFTQLPTGPQTTAPGQTSTYVVEMDDPDSTSAPTITVLNPPSTDPSIFSTATTTSADGKTTLTISFKPTAAQEGSSYIVNVRGRDATGLTSDQSITLTVPDITPPVVPSSLALAASSDTGAANSDGLTNVTLPTLTGTTEAGAIVTVLLNGAAIGTTTANGFGVWNFTPGAALTNGTYSFTASATDAAGNTSVTSAPAAFTVDATPPAVPEITSPALTGSIVPTIAGTAEANSTVTIAVGGATYATIASNDGTWFLDLGSATPASGSLVLDITGANAVQVTATDAAGNLSAATVQNLVIDTTLPVTPVILSSPLTNSVNPILAGTAETGSTVTVSVGSATYTIATTTEGTWTLDLGSATPASGTLVLNLNGANTVQATSTDAAGNTSAVAAQNLLIDTTLPAAPTATLDPDSDTGTLGDLLTSVVQPILRGTAESGNRVDVYDGTNLLGTATASAGGTWTLPVSSPLAEGQHNLSVLAIDPAGNSSTAFLAALVVDTTPPTTPAVLSSPLSSSVAPTISGTAEGNSTVTVAVGGATYDVLAAGDGSWSLDLATVVPASGVLALNSNGTNAVQVTATDAAGNASTIAALQSLVVDTIPPGVSALALDASSDTGILGDNITSFFPPTFSGSAEPGSRIDLFSGGSLIGTTTVQQNGLWSLTSTELGEGSHTLTARVTDTAGNASLPSSPLLLAIDRTLPSAPALTGLAPGSDTGVPGDNVTTRTTPTLTGVGEAGSLVTLYDTDGVAVLGTATVQQDGTWSVTSSALSVGNHNLTTVVTDAAGNVSATSSPFLVSIAAFDLPPIFVSGSNFSGQVKAVPYEGPVSYLQYEFLGTASGEAVVSTALNDFVSLGGGDDAADGREGNDVLDGGTGSNFLTGGAGQDVFFLDARDGGTTWSTITDWSGGEQLSLWGWRPGVSQVTWIDQDGAEGYKGVTMHADIDSNGVIDTSVTWTGLTRTDLPQQTQQDGLLWFA